MSLSTIAEHFPRSALQLRRTNTTISTPQLVPQHRATSVEQFPENQDIIE
jgi:hypothetical protein